MSLGDMITLLKLRRGNYSLVEEKVPEDAKAVGMMIKDMPLPEHVVIAAIIRKGEVTIPRGVSVIEADDEILALADKEGAYGSGGIVRRASEKPSGICQWKWKILIPAD